MRSFATEVFLSSRHAESGAISSGDICCLNGAMPVPIECMGGALSVFHVSSNSGLCRGDDFVCAVENCVCVSVVSGVLVTVDCSAELC